MAQLTTFVLSIAAFLAAVAFALGRLSKIIDLFKALAGQLSFKKTCMVKLALTFRQDDLPIR
jgi:hypothetical protein